MDKQVESVRVLDNFDINLSLDNRGDGRHQVTSVELDLQALTFRLSYRDILLVTSIVNRAIELSSQMPDREDQERVDGASTGAVARVDVTSAKSTRTRAMSSSQAPRRQSSVPKAKVIMSKETVSSDPYEPPL